MCQWGWPRPTSRFTLSPMALPTQSLFPKLLHGAEHRCSCGGLPGRKEVTFGGGWETYEAKGGSSLCPAPLPSHPACTLGTHLLPACELPVLEADGPHVVQPVLGHEVGGPLGVAVRVMCPEHATGDNRTGGLPVQP